MIGVRPIQNTENDFFMMILHSKHKIAGNSYICCVDDGSHQNSSKFIFFYSVNALRATVNDVYMLLFLLTLLS